MACGLVRAVSLGAFGLGYSKFGGALARGLRAYHSLLLPLAVCALLCSALCAALASMPSTPGTIP